MPRKRFNTDEKAIIAESDGQIVEWQNVTQWHKARDLGTIRTDELGWQYVEGTNLDKNTYLRPGETVRITPGHIRRTTLMQARADNAANPTYKSPDANATEYREQPKTLAEMRYAAAESLASEFGTDVDEWLV